MREKISVIIPTYNRAHCVRNAIDSVLAQSPPADEIIVINDGSTDDTSKVLASYGNKIKVIEQENGGAGAARTSGLNHATSDWITFLDSDDLWYPGRLELLHRDISSPCNREIVLHFADFRLTGEGYDQGFFDLRQWEIPQDATRIINDPLSYALQGLHLNSAAVRADAAAKTDGFPAKLTISQDIYFLASIALQGPALFSRKTVAEVRRLPGDTTANMEIFKTNRVAAFRICQERLELLERLSMSPDQKALLRRHKSANLFSLAQAEAEAGLTSHRKQLFSMIKEHPNSLKAVLKAIPPFALGSIGYRLVGKRKKGFTRVR